MDRKDEQGTSVRRRKRGRGRSEWMLASVFTEKSVNCVLFDVRRSDENSKDVATWCRWLISATEQLVFLNDPPKWQQRWRVSVFHGEWFHQRVRVTTVWWVRHSCLYSQLNHSKVHGRPGGGSAPGEAPGEAWSSQGPQWELKPASLAPYFHPANCALGQLGWKMEPVRQGLVYDMKYRSCQGNSRRSCSGMNRMKSHSRRPHVNPFSEHQCVFSGAEPRQSRGESPALTIPLKDLREMHLSHICVCSQWGSRRYHLWSWSWLGPWIDVSPLRGWISP